MEYKNLLFRNRLLVLAVFCCVHVVAQDKHIASFAARYKEYRTIIGNDGREVNSLASFEVAVHDHIMRMSKELRPGIISTTVNDITKKSSINYLKDEYDSLQKSMEFADFTRDIFPIGSRPGDEVKVRFVDQQRVINKDTCKLAVVNWRDDDVYVWYKPGPFLQPTQFSNTLFSTIPGLPVVISFKDKRMQLPMIAGTFMVYLLDSFFVPDHPGEYVQAGGMVKYPVVDNSTEYSSRLRKMMGLHPPDNSVNMQAVLPFLQYKMKEAGY